MTRPNPPILLAFDDGDDSHYSQAFSYMQTKGIKGTAYVYSDGVDDAGNVTSAQLQEMFAAGWTIGNHSQGTVDLTTLTEAQQEASLDACRDFLAGLGITTGTHVAYPQGSNNADTLTAMAAQGMLTGRTVVSGAFNIPYAGNNYQINCQDVSSLSLATVQGLISNAINTGQVLFILIHRIEAGGGAGVWTITNFQALIDYIVAQGSPVKTMAEFYTEYLV